MLIQEMRNRSHGIVAKIIVGLIVVVFAMFGFGSITTFLVRVPKVATVNGDDITEQQMQIAVERQRRLLLANSQTSPEEIDDDQLRKTVLNDLIDRTLMNQAVSRMGLYFSDSKLDADMINTPSFQVDGKFDADRFQLLLRSAGYTPLTYRDVIRQESMSRQIGNGLAESEFVTPIEIDYVASLSQQLRNIAYLQIKLEDLKQVVVVDQQAVADYYDAHQNEFFTEEQVDLQYLEVRKEDLTDQVKVEPSDLHSYYEQEKDNYVQPGERRASHILIEVNDDTTTEQAKEKVDVAYNRIINGEDFAKVAEEVSEDPGSAEKGGDLGYNQQGTFVEAFEETLDGLTLNEISKPVLTEFGYHIIKLTGIKEPITPTFDELAERLEKDYRLLKAEELFVAKSSKLSELAYESPDLEGVAMEIDLPVKSTGWISRATTTGLAANSQVMNAAFSDDLLIDGNNSDLIEIDPDDHVVVRVKEHRAAVAKQFADVQAEIRSGLVVDAAREKAAAKAEEALDLLRGGSITRFVADQVGGSWVVRDSLSRQDPDVDPQIVLAAFKLARPAKDEKSLGSTVLDNGDSVVISVTKVIDKDVSDMPEEGKRSLARLLTTGKGNFTYAEFRKNLKETADIEKL